MRVLIVEDEISISAALKKGLEKEGYAIDVAYTGESAKALIDVYEYDLIVLDVNLPGIDGIAVLKELRECNPLTRVIIVSANRTIDDRIRGLDSGANDYMIKPFDLQELKARIRALLRRDFASRPSIVNEGGFELDLSTHRVSYMDRELILTLKEYSILKYLIQNKDRIISSEELHEHIWNDDSNPFTDVMRVHIYSLRKKLMAATGKNDIISTVRKVGYRLNI